jgi:phage tail-like protein
MAQFVLNPTRIDPYKNFKFKLVWDDEGTLGPIAGVSKVSGLKRTTEVVSHRDGGDLSTKRHSPGVSSFEPITIERGITHDPAFENWATKVYSTAGDGGVSLLNFRKDITIELYNLQGVKVRAWNVFRCWVSEFVAVPELDANANAVAFEHIVLQNEGFARDEAVVETAEF